MPHPPRQDDETTSARGALCPGRRRFLGGAAAAVACGLLGRPARAEERDWTGARTVRYPDADIISLDARFDRYRIGNTPIQRLHTGTLWAEGSAWNGAGKYVVWSDIPNDLQLRWIEDDGRVTVFRRPAGNSNGNTFDWQGRQISCEHGNRRVVRYEHDGSVTVLADKWQGKPLNAPNDAVVHPDGAIWFTDPGYGSMMNYEGKKGELMIKEAVYRLDSSGKLEMATDELAKPNGLCFSPDYKKLYIADTGGKDPKEIRVWEVGEGAKLSRGRTFVSMRFTKSVPAGTGPWDRWKLHGGELIGDGVADGIRADTDGNIWAAAGWVGKGYDGVHVFAPDGARIGLILLPEICGNLCFGGPKRNRLFMAASQSLYAVYVETQGAHIT